MSKEPRVEMINQNHFPPSGPALFMGRQKRVPITLQGITIKMRLWDQPVEVYERVSQRVLRVRKSDPPRITSKSPSRI